VVCALGGKLIARKNLLVNKLLLCTGMYASLLSPTSSWVVTREDRKRDQRARSVQLCPASQAFRPASRSWSVTLCPVSSLITFCASRASWPRRGSADQTLPGLLGGGRCTGAGDAPLDGTPSRDEPCQRPQSAFAA